MCVWFHYLVNGSIPKKKSEEKQKQEVDDKLKLPEFEKSSLNWDCFGDLFLHLDKFPDQLKEDLCKFLLAAAQYWTGNYATYVHGLNKFYVKRDDENGQNEESQAKVGLTD